MPALVILILLFRPEGLLPRQHARISFPAAKPQGSSEARAMSAMSALLACKRLTCRFGGLVALDRVDFEVERRRDRRPDRAERFRQDHAVQRRHRDLRRRRGHGRLRRQRHDRRDAASGLSRRHHPHLPALAHVPAAFGVRQHHGRQSQAAQPRPGVQSAPSRRLRRGVRAQLGGGARAGHGVQSGAGRPHRRAGRRPADDRPAAHRDLPRAHQPAPPRSCSTSRPPA